MIARQKGQLYVFEGGGSSRLCPYTRQGNRCKLFLEDERVLRGGDDSRQVSEGGRSLSVGTRFASRAPCPRTPINSITTGRQVEGARRHQDRRDLGDSTKVDSWSKRTEKASLGHRAPSFGRTQDGTCSGRRHVTAVEHHPRKGTLGVRSRVASKGGLQTHPGIPQPPASPPAIRCGIPTAVFSVGTVAGKVCTCVRVLRVQGRAPARRDPRAGPPTGVDLGYQHSPCT